MKMTARDVETLTAPEGKSDHIEWFEEMPGFGVRVRGDKKYFVIQYRIGQKQRRESLKVGKFKLKEARAIAENRFAQVKLGIDPRAQRDKARETARIFGLHSPPAKPHPTYSRLSRYDSTGLLWLLRGRRVVALTADTAAIENASGAVLVYRKASH